jgi:hypothetical protein
VAGWLGVGPSGEYVIRNSISTSIENNFVIPATAGISFDAVHLALNTGFPACAGMTVLYFSYQMKWNDQGQTKSRVGG